MTKDNWLALFVLSVLGVAGWLLVNRPKPDDIWEGIEKDWWG